MYRRSEWLISILFVAAHTASAHPPSEFPEPYSWIPKNVVVRDAIYAATAVIDDVSLSGAMVAELTGGATTQLHAHESEPVAGDIARVTDIPRLTDDRGPGWWVAGADVFSASLVYDCGQLEQIAVQGYPWPLVPNGGHISYEYSDGDSTRIVGFTLRRESGRSALSTRSNRVEWMYASTDYDSRLATIGGLAPLAGEPLASRLNGLGRMGGF